MCEGGLRGKEEAPLQQRLAAEREKTHGGDGRRPEEAEEKWRLREGVEAWWVFPNEPHKETNRSHPAVMSAGLL